MEIKEIVKHMKHVPSYLERRKPVQDRGLSFGVMDWARLEKWQTRHHKHGSVKSNKYSPSSTCSSSLFSADESSPGSSKASSKEEVLTPRIQSCSKVVKKLHYSDDFPKQSCVKGKLKIQDESVNNNNHPNSFIISKTPCKSELKPRSISPLRRFSFSLKSGTERPDSSVSQTSNKDSKRAHSSPLSRLLDPIFPSKETCHQDSRTKARVKLDFTKEIRADDVSSASSSRKQALFQMTVKNDRLLFTFAVENNMEILAATVKENNKNSLYTFFTVHEVKKKNISWLSNGNKSKDHNYVPNITAQMKVSNSRFDTREFVLFSVNANVQPLEELEAVVVKFSRNMNGDINRESFDTTVILPGGSHGVASKGLPSPLVDRWRSCGTCDCGGWDVGCRLRTLSKQMQSSGSRSGQFDLFFKGEVESKRPIFSLSSLKEGIFSIEYNASLSPLQAFSICISYVESRKLTQHTELRTHTREAVPLVYTPIPRIKRNMACKVAL
ncbi:uncharacterized protein LOC143606332 [Bidens hawaiensis]|uniref:uncharacterized protein LOC143606332 n=1 Tax=Bidens hawaiensis TaxID=980011 RepID=UPI004048FA65